MILVTRGFELVTRRFELATRGSELLTREFEFQLVLLSFQLVTRNSCFTISQYTYCSISHELKASIQ